MTAISDPKNIISYVSNKKLVFIVALTCDHDMLLIVLLLQFFFILWLVSIISE